MSRLAGHFALWEMGCHAPLRSQAGGDTGAGKLHILTELGSSRFSRFPEVDSAPFCCNGRHLYPWNWRFRSTFILHPRQGLSRCQRESSSSLQPAPALESCPVQGRALSQSSCSNQKNYGHLCLLSFSQSPSPIH